MHTPEADNISFEKKSELNSQAFQKQSTSFQVKKYN